MGKNQDVREVDVEDGNLPATVSSQTEPPNVLVALAATVERLVARNEKCIGDLSGHRKLTIFHGERPPSISIAKYLERIYKYTNCSPSCFVAGFVYIDRLIHRQPHIPIISLNAHRLLMTSIMIATKLFDDIHYNNAFYSRVGGIGIAELNGLELDFLFRLDFRVQVTLNVFEGYCTYLQKELLKSDRVSTTLPTFGRFGGSYGVLDKEKSLEDAQKNLLLFLNGNSTTLAAALARGHSGPRNR